MVDVATEAPEVVIPSSAEEAVSAFGDGDGTTVLAGGTIVMVELVHGRLAPRRVLMLERAGLSGIARDGGRVTIGAMTPVTELEEAPDPLATAARYVGDPEVRAQATLGGNLCAPPGLESPRGDLQAALVALGAEVRSAGAGGERSEPVEEFLASGPDGRLVLDVSFSEPQAAASASVRRPHAHAYTILAVHGTRTDDGLRLAASGAGPRAVRLRSAEQGDASRALDDASLGDDALASAWYRERTLPVLVGRVLSQLA
jgi:aerobic carbon-monoxide dehydrogenase medium subunit